MRPAVTLVGEAPSRANGKRAPFDGPSWRRVCRLLELEPPAARLLIRAVNILPRWPGACGKGSRFPPARARRAASRRKMCGAKGQG